MAHFEVPVNLPHAARVAGRIEMRLVLAGVPDLEEGEELRTLMSALRDALSPYDESNDPSDAEAADAVREVAEIARKLVDEIERLALGEDRLGQAVRNLFECLGLGAEGAGISLRAGENPGSLLRPV
jgi:hypothetical protein